MGARFLFVAVAFFAAVLVLETIALRPGLARPNFLKVNCDGTCKRICHPTLEIHVEGQCRFYQKCCNKDVVDLVQPKIKPECSTYRGATCRVIGNGKCPEPEAAVHGAPCRNKSARCCMRKPPNSEFNDGFFQIVGLNAVYQKKSTAIISGAETNQRGVRLGSKTRSKGLRNRSRHLN